MTIHIWFTGISPSTLQTSIIESSTEETIMFTRKHHYATLIALLAAAAACSDDDESQTPHPSDAGTETSSDTSSSPPHTSSDPRSSTSNDPLTSTDGTSTDRTLSSESSDASPPPDDSTSTESNGTEPNTHAPTSEPLDAGTTSSNDTSTPDDTSATDAGTIDVEVAKAYFWQAFTAQRIDDGPLATEQLELALAANPGDAELALLVAHSHLWRISEFTRGSNPDPSQLPFLAGATEAGFGRAYALAPADARILGWLGSVMIGNGNATSDAEKVANGHGLIELGVAQYPEFNGFVLSLVNSTFPADTPEFALALEAMWDNLDVCAGFTADREDPDVRAALEVVLAGSADPVCANTLRAAHNLEGFFLYFGDLLVKANQPTAASAMYDATKASPTFHLWPYRETLLAREADLETRLNAYTNDDPSDDPPLISQEPHTCSYCHAADPSQTLPYSLDPLP